jgi:nitrate/TMAO reductase-like tetraheme cytochrome c subunit
MNHRFLKVSFFVILGVIILFAVFVEYSTSPQFCNSCHIMEPYFNAWKTSTHDFVLCVDCHYMPGLQSQARSKFEAMNQVVSYVTRTYGSKPRAEISDWSCLRPECHSQRLLQGRVDFLGIHFDHQPHLVEVRRGLKLRCTSCHSQIVQGTHMTVTTSTCFLCHFKDVTIGESISGCPACHPPPEATIEFEGILFNHSEVVEREIQCLKCHVQVVQGSGDVSRERCLICHGEPERIEKYDDLTLIHSKHVSDHKVDCEECHNAIQHGLVKMVSTLEVDCSSCHPDHHSEVKELYMGVGGKEVPANPSSMFTTRVGCTGCHLVHKEVEGLGDVKVSSEASCMHCHGTKFYGMLENWKTEISSSLQSMIKILDRAGNIISGSKGKPGYANSLMSLEVARHNIRVVELGGGVHNVGYSIELLQSAYQSIQKSLRDVGSTYQPSPPRLIVTSGPAKESCSTCHVGMRLKKLKVFGLDFVHATHLEEELDCLECHEGLRGYSEEGHGVLKLTEGDCWNCHHSGESFDCQKCHEDFRVKTFEYRDRVFSHEVHLEKTDERCIQCHGGTTGKNVIVGKGVDCHTCHHKQEKMACESCHTVQDLFFRGQGVGGLSADANVMMDMVACVDCHLEIEEEHSIEAVRQSCIDCHEEEYGVMLDDWQNVTVEALNDVKENYHEAIGREPVQGTVDEEKTAKTLGLAAERIDWVEKDGSKGVHNPYLAQILIDSASREIQQILDNR